VACIFCKIASGEIPSEMVVESELSLAFLDVRPLVRGHVLVIPRRHAERVADMTREEAADVMALAQRIVRRQEKALGAQGVTLAINDGRAAGQEVLHVHLHLVPRSEGDGHGPIHWLFGGHAALREGELKEIGAMLRG
jgi:histidine triad (HIT) family protein